LAGNVFARPIWNQAFASNKFNGIFELMLGNKKLVRMPVFSCLFKDCAFRGLSAIDQQVVPGGMDGSKNSGLLSLTLSIQAA
jgi:hypothetical protein